MRRLPRRVAQSFALFVSGLLAGSSGMVALAAGPLHVTVSASVVGFCNSPVWNEVTFHANVTGGVPPYAYLWSFGDGSSPSTDEGPIHHYANEGFYTANVTVTDSTGANATGSSTFGVGPPPCPPPYNRFGMIRLIPNVILLIFIGLLLALLVVRARRRTSRP